MSRLETDVRHHLEPMLLGKSVTLDTVQQSLLATWAYKTMAMAQFANSNIPPFPRRHLEHLYTFLEPPKNMNIWSAFWGGTVTHTLPMHDYGFYDSRVIDKDHPPEAVNIPYRYSATVRIDKVAFQLVGIDDDNAVNISPGFDRGFWGDSNRYCLAHPYRQYPLAAEVPRDRRWVDEVHPAFCRHA